jgi:signal recognition particle receptor subunit beta
MGKKRAASDVLSAKSRQGRTVHSDPGSVGLIGATLEDVRTDLLGVSEMLGASLEGDSRTFVQDSRCLLQTMVCRIAVVGQVKAGKSSFINALIRQPQLLPTNVNPWTTAVTRLHFSHPSHFQDIAAEFRFFELDEWQRLAEGGGQLRQLTERLVPDFEPELLAKHLLAMRNRAAARLGGEFTQLLGTSHRFRAVDRETLEAYVCSGTSTTGNSRAPGYYADITKTADLYLDGGPFSFPTIVIDTPGTNDPFLVRDEITRQSLDTADLYIVVLSARQALSTADVALMRILRGLQKERMIIFVNRIDELDNLDSDLHAIETQVERGLQQEFPGVEIPIVYGSAHLALQILSGKALRVPPALAEYTVGFPRTPANASTDGDSAALQSIRELLFKCSGMARLAQTLDRCILQSDSGRVLQDIVMRFSALSRVDAVTTRDELQRLESTLGTDADAIKAEQELGGELDRLQGAAERIEKSLSEFETTLKTTVDDDTRLLQANLGGIIEQYAQAECLRLEESIRAGHQLRTWRCEPARLRQRLEQEFWEQFKSIDAKRLVAEAEIMPGLRQAMAQFLPGDAGARALDLRPASTLLPSIGALGKAVALDLDDPWWRRWWARKQSTSERANELAQLIRYEFQPIAENLAEAAREQLLADVAATIQKISSACLAVVEQMRRHCREQRASLHARSQPAASTAGAAEHLNQLQDKLKVCESLQARLDALEMVFAQPE